MSLLSKKKTQQGKQLTTEKNLQTTVDTSINSMAPPELKSAKKRSGWSFPIPKAAWNKTSNDEPATYERTLNRANPGQQQAKQDQEEDAHKPWFDMTEEERTTSSMKWSKEINAELYGWSSKDMENPNFEHFNEKTKEILTNINEISKPKSKVRKRLIIDTSIYLRELKHDLASLQQIDKNDVELLSQKTIEFNNKYKGYTQQELDILATYASVITAEQVGNLDVGANEVRDATDDNLFLTKGYKLNTPKNGEDGTVYDKELVKFGKESDYTDWPLFAHEPDVTDVEQGDVGDCYFLAAINAVVEHDPNVIKNMMKDEGDTVVVRFYDRKGKPLFVRVKKTLPHWYYTGKDKDGNPTEKFSGGYAAKKAIWVKFLEKAYTVVRAEIDDPKTLEKADYSPKKKYGAFDIIDQGYSGGVLRNFLGNKIKIKKRTLSGLKLSAKYVKISKLYKNVRDGEKAEVIKNLKKTNPNAGEKEWNFYKAKEIFGMDIKTTDDPLYELIASNRVFNTYESFLTNKLNEYISLNRNMRTQAEFHSVMDLDYFLSDIKLEEMPELGIDKNIEERIKKHYIQYFMRRTMASGILKNYYNMSGNYSKDELKVFDELTNALNGQTKKVVTASSTGFWSFSRKQRKGTGLNGEDLRFGFAGGHEYSLVKTTTRKAIVNGKEVTHRFVVMQNPWRNNAIRLYDKDTGLAYGTMHKTSNEIHGTFEMELTDFINTMKQYDIAG